MALIINSCTNLPYLERPASVPLIQLLFSWREHGEYPNNLTFESSLYSDVSSTMGCPTEGLIPAEGRVWDQHRGCTMGTLLSV